MTKEKLVTLVQKNLVGGIINDDNVKKFSYRDVELKIALVWGDVLSQFKAKKQPIDNLYMPYPVDIVDGRGFIPISYITGVGSCPALYAEDLKSHAVIYPRKSASARVVMNGLQASRSINTFTIKNKEVIFDGGIENGTVMLNLLPSFEAIDDTEELILPPGAQNLIFSLVAESEASKLQMPQNNTNDKV